jgi:hypothetical protein
LNPCRITGKNPSASYEQNAAGTITFMLKSYSNYQAALALDKALRFHMIKVCSGNFSAPNLLSF